MLPNNQCFVLQVGITFITNTGGEDVRRQGGLRGEGVQRVSGETWDRVRLDGE